MIEQIAAFTPTAIVTALASGLVMGIWLPHLFAALTEPLIPEQHVATLTSRAHRLIPLLLLPVGAAFYLAPLLDPNDHRAIRLVEWIVFGCSAGLGAAVWQRVRPSRVTGQLREEAARNVEEAEASERRVARLRAEVEAIRR